MEIKRGGLRGVAGHSRGTHFQLHQVPRQLSIFGIIRKMLYPKRGHVVGALYGRREEPIILSAILRF